MEWRVSSFFICCLVFYSCTDVSNTEKKTLNERSYVENKEIKPKDSYKSKPITFISSDTISTVKGRVIKTIYSFENGLKITQQPSWKISQEHLTQWKIGIQKSINDTAQNKYEYHFDVGVDVDKDNTFLETYVLEVE